MSISPGFPFFADNRPRPHTLPELLPCRHPTPTFDPLPDQTSHAELLLAGHAEPGAKIALSRTPDFPREYKVPAIVADPVTARWSAVVPLAENVLKPLAFDAGVFPDSGTGVGVAQTQGAG